MQSFVKETSIVRKIWGKADVVLFIFAGSAAEFALNKAVDWLYFTGKLPADPIGRLFSTVGYAQQIVFSSKSQAIQAIDKFTSIHKSVEKSRGQNIPDWAYRDVLYMLIDYSIRSYEVLEKRLSIEEQVEVFEVFLAVGKRMGINGLPVDFEAWSKDRKTHIEQDLLKSELTDDLFLQYKKHLGTLRFFFLKEVQKMILPESVADKLGFAHHSKLMPLLKLYKWSALVNLQWFIKGLLLPKAYMAQVKGLEKV
jgi:hypothetical protein